MNRKGIIFLLTHFYPLFVSLHLVLGDWCKKCQLLFNIVPILVFGGLFAIWNKTSHIKLSQPEKTCISYLIMSIIFIYCYYCICVMSPPKWVYGKNIMAGGVGFITLCFYIYLYYERSK